MTQPFSSRWILEFEKQLYRRKHILLYGNVNDQLIWRNSYQTLSDFLQAYFLDSNFELVARYDQLEKWKFATPDMRDTFDELALRRNLEAFNELEQAFCHLLGLLSQPQTSVAALVDLGDLLASDSISKGRHPLLLLKKCTLEASVINQGALQGRRNTIVIVTGDLQGVPEWFYKNNPFLSMVQISLPNQEERRQFALRFLRPTPDGKGGFYQGDRLTQEQIEILAEEFANLTEGFRTIDLDALRITSMLKRMPLQAKEVWKLIDFFKFGVRDNPWGQLNKEKVMSASEQLTRNVIGQPRAVKAVTTMLTSARVGLSLTPSSAGSGKPQGIFFFVGPTGVGKTELAKALTKLVFGDERAFARFDMSEYKQEQAAEKLTGAPPGFVGYEAGGQLTNRVMEQPYSILLFDEIEKAHPKILDKFLQILEDGRLTDGKGQTAYFNQTAIIFTSNIGASDLTEPHTGKLIRQGIMNLVQQGNVNNFSYEQIAEHFKQEVTWYFTNYIGRAEILNRLGDNIVVFDLLRPEFVGKIGAKFLGFLQESAREKYQLNLQFQPSVLQILSQKMEQGDNLLFGGRRIKTMLETLIERPINSWIFQQENGGEKLTGKTLEVELTGEGKLTCRVG